MTDPIRMYLLWFAHEHVDFRGAEIDSILNLFGISQEHFKTIQRSNDKPYWIVECSEEATIQTIASRSVSLRYCIELYVRERDFSSVHSALRQIPRERWSKYARQDKTFRIVVETFCKHISQSEKIEKIESFNYLQIEGQVRLNNPDVSFYYMEYYGMKPDINTENPEELFFGRLVATGQRELIQKLSLKTRKFIGTTSMDPQLSLLMANQAQVKRGDIVMDPFVGTGSLLVAAALFDGYILGTDIDFMMLHARTRPTRITQKKRSSDESVAANVKQYGKGEYYLDVIVSDFSQLLWRSDMRVNAIITDPPYGVREATERIGTSKPNPTIDETQAAAHIPSKIDYNLPHMYKDIMKFAARHLEINGKLVCWFPVYREHYSEDQLPRHPCLKMTANSEQVLSNHASRRLLTYTKLREPHESDVISTMNILDFREMYFALRDESRKEKRMKRAAERAQNKAEWERRCRESTER
ncbi:tRNA (guanine(10)-N2)-methyltransferase homolog [Fopius arisanus]|uniref:tRNA (guanine(10)-N(2))-methyltransferase TRMT11 n=1 Tax=Fopius arisanus TaxID=64838 RepID=A0A9R1T6J8_9HYME|nr:PREDICTED: tRNA (guanine(10)-N2)-methyltransferase homolog [Fopius arisanus]